MRVVSRPRDVEHVDVSIGKSGCRFGNMTDGDALLAALHQAGAVASPT